MRVPRVFTEQALAAHQNIVLRDQAAHYLSRVLRMQVGRDLVLFDGSGGEYPASIVAIDRKSVSLQTGAHCPAERESPLAVELAIGVSRGERMDWVLQKATELGVSSISPLFTEHGEVQLAGERLQKKQRHWQQILVSACEQSQRNHLPQLREAQSLAHWIANVEEPCRLVLHHRSDSVLPVDQPAPTAVVLLVGPEGGLSADEIQLAQQRGFQPLALGPRVLRTETAPLAALSIVQFLWGDLGGN